METRFVILIALSVFTLKNVKANGEDSLKTKYDLNDPRNPNCPCHKYQKQADEEYKTLLASQNKGRWETKDNADRTNSGTFSNSDRQTNNLSSENSNGSDKIKKHRSDYSKKHKRKKKGKKYNKWLKIWEVNNWDIWKRVPKADSCHRW